MAPTIYSVGPLIHADVLNNEYVGLDKRVSIPFPASLCPKPPAVPAPTETAQAEPTTRAGAENVPAPSKKKRSRPAAAQAQPAQAAEPPEDFEKFRYTGTNQRPRTQATIVSASASSGGGLQQDSREPQLSEVERNHTLLRESGSRLGFQVCNISSSQFLTQRGRRLS
eukprot:TRINITY_DN6164_c0_g1_i5.p1 TRINITY_DN6164_c0_g1~~TRINITY_DN6164_c0_g1_i5.p1  ORF type:complete len:168 (-),score=14.55 TRINITY_DN6164_c0_g1_i5:332-835(-)